jgi:hypothetical protein
MAGRYLIDRGGSEFAGSISRPREEQPSHDRTGQVQVNAAVGRHYRVLTPVTGRTQMPNQRVKPDSDAESVATITGNDITENDNGA